MNLHRLPANLDYHQRVAEAADNPTTAMLQWQAARLLHEIHQPAADERAQRLIFTEQLHATQRTQHRR